MEGGIYSTPLDDKLAYDIKCINTKYNINLYKISVTLLSFGFRRIRIDLRNSGTVLIVIDHYYIDKQAFQDCYRNIEALLFKYEVEFRINRFQGFMLFCREIKINIYRFILGV